MAALVNLLEIVIQLIIDFEAIKAIMSGSNNDSNFLAIGCTPDTFLPSSQNAFMPSEKGLIELDNKVLP